MSRRSERLTRRELEILGFIAQGYLNKQIADKSGASCQTVKNQVSSILRKLGAYNRAHAVLLAQEDGLLCRKERASVKE